MAASLALCAIAWPYLAKKSPFARAGPIRRVHRPQRRAEQGHPALVGGQSPACSRDVSGSWQARLHYPQAEGTRPIARLPPPALAARL